MATKTKASIITEISGRGIATLTLRRTAENNTFNEELVERLRRELQGLENDPKVRLIVLKAEGGNFCGGSDPAWMKRMIDDEHATNFEDARNLGKMMAVLYRMRQPTVAMVSGQVFGVGVGVVSACDIVIADEGATFALPEVRFGLIPAVIGPYVIYAVGERQATRYMMTGEEFDAKEAHRVNPVHEVATPGSLEERCNALVDNLLKGGPGALSEVKNLVSYVTSSKTQDEKVVRDTAGHIARLRASPEGREGIEAHLEGRPAKWVK